MSEIFRMQNIEYEINRKRILTIPKFRYWREWLWDYGTKWRRQKYIA